jgi:hypothetical protein
MRQAAANGSATQPKWPSYDAKTIQNKQETRFAQGSPYELL